jgi:hypothetical protein
LFLDGPFAGLEGVMSVWQEPTLNGTLSSREGALVSVSIKVDPRDLEVLLEALARIDFPINPQIYHDAAVVYFYADGSERSESATLVEFPAYAGRLEEVRDALAAYAFDPADMQVTGMLDAIRAGDAQEPAPPGAGYAARWHVKQKACAAVH